MARYDAMTLRINYLGITIQAAFKGGNGRDKKARLVTSSVLAQDAIEHDPRFGKIITLVEKYSDTPAAKQKAEEERQAPKRIPKVKTVNDALLYFTRLGANITGESNLEDLMSQYNVEFPNLRR